MAYERDPNELGALWLKSGAKGEYYMTGTINGEKVVCFRARKQSDKSPDWRVLKSVPRDDRTARQTDDNGIDY
jgi:uncharacterized protein (DUF736 family)